MKLERILVPTDFSEFSALAAGLARPLALASGATVHVIHVRVPVEAAFEVPEIGVLLRKLPPDDEVLQQQLDAFADLHFARYRVPVVTVLADGKPAPAIAQYARAAQVGRIVIGTHASGIMKRLLRGSVSKSLLEYAPCAVLMVPPTADAGDGFEAEYRGQAPSAPMAMAG